MNPTSPLTQIGKYKILSELGRGGMGVVYRAEDKFIGREVAIKTLADATPEMRQRFAIEARSGVLNHPNIVTVYDFGEHEGNPYIVMEFLRGLTLERIVKENHPLALVDKLDIVRQVCEGLGYAHSRGVVHRDIKPANVVLLGNGNVKLVDFGIAQLESLSGHTMAGSVIGTYQYLSPERLKGEPSDGRGDIWSAGVLLYLLLTGTLPFPGEDISALHRVITDPYPPLGSLLSSAYPESLDNIVARALAKDPAERYPTALEMAGDLEGTRDALRLSRVEDLLGQARSLIDKDELLRARPLLLDLQRLAPQNTAVRNLLRELQTRLSQGPEPRAGVSGVSNIPAKQDAPLPETNGAARLRGTGDAVAEAALPHPAAAPPLPQPPVSQEEERRRRIIEQIVVEIRAQAERGNRARALELVGRSLERAPENPALLALQAELSGKIASAEPEPAPAISAVLAEPFAADPVPVPPAAAVAALPVPTPVPEPLCVRETDPAPAEEPVAQSELASQPELAPGPVPALQSEPIPAPVPVPTPVLAAAPFSASLEPKGAAPAAAVVLETSDKLPVEKEPIGAEVKAAPLPGPSMPAHALTIEEVAAPVAIPPSPVAALPATSAAFPTPSVTVPVPVAEPIAVAPASPDTPSATPRESQVTGSVTPSQTNPVPERPQMRAATIAVVDTPVLQPEKRQTHQTPRAAEHAPTTQPARSAILVLAAVAAGLLVAVLLLAVRHHHRAAALPVTYAQLVASPYARVLRLTASNGESVPLPAGDHMTPLRVDGLRPGAYTLDLQGAGGGTTQAHCNVDAQQHLCLATVTPLSDADIESILNGGTRQ